MQYTHADNPELQGRRCGGGVHRRGPTAVVLFWRRVGLCRLRVDKGDTGNLPDMIWSGGEHAVDDHNLAAPSGHSHADFGIVQSVPKQASTRLPSLGALKGKRLRH